jgi:hypothetical protein
VTTQVNNDAFRPSFATCRAILAGLTIEALEHVVREHNTAADTMANHAADGRTMEVWGGGGRWRFSSSSCRQRASSGSHSGHRDMPARDSTNLEGGLHQRANGLVPSHAPERARPPEPGSLVSSGLWYPDLQGVYPSSCVPRRCPGITSSVGTQLHIFPQRNGSPSSGLGRGPEGASPRGLYRLHNLVSSASCEICVRRGASIHHILELL